MQPILHARQAFPPRSELYSALGLGQFISSLTILMPEESCQLGEACESGELDLHLCSGTYKLSGFGHRFLCLDSFIHKSGTQPLSSQLKGMKKALEEGEMTWANTSFQMLSKDEMAHSPAAQWTTSHLCCLSMDPTFIVQHGFAFMWKFAVSPTLYRRPYAATIVASNKWILFCDIPGKKRYLGQCCSRFLGNNVRKGSISDLGKTLSVELRYSGSKVLDSSDFRGRIQGCRTDYHVSKPPHAHFLHCLHIGPPAVYHCLALLSPIRFHSLAPEGHKSTMATLFSYLLVRPAIMY